MEGDFKSVWKGRRINDLLIRRPFPFTRVTRRVVQSEGYGDTGGHVFLVGARAGAHQSRTRLAVHPSAPPEFPSPSGRRRNHE